MGATADLSRDSRDGDSAHPCFPHVAIAEVVDACSGTVAKWIKIIIIIIIGIVEEEE